MQHTAIPASLDSISKTWLFENRSLIYRHTCDWTLRVEKDEGDVQASLSSDWEFGPGDGIDMVTSINESANWESQNQQMTKMPL